MGGSYPLFRDLVEGDEGDDVRMLQQALRNNGYDVAVDGVFGSYTAQCVKDLYARVGSSSLTVSVPSQSRSAHDDSGTTSTRTQGSPVESGRENTSATSDSQAKGAVRIRVPRSEFVMLSCLPAQVNSVPPVGTVLTSETAQVSVSGTDLTLTATIPASVASGLNDTIDGSAQRGTQPFLFVLVM
ncbi:peptidoglycan-binding domain-containing protein [Actinomyces vulturis]|uniref:peptidoglycan-binding domain-containing protein n=1 Tax=Actinomyces vulturis TaxID=1857645 RepID=UPI0009F6B613|nr:peptidoglycan-binding domain-containing protein [Actinomyces vulturis]